ncbi:MAG: G5 domain-containing protein, partial [Candidatus Nomurabacteria bacterium]|nr:G5 domain-containing protein [Candidatus Nomurabacteria bacterium]
AKTVEDALRQKNIAVGEYDMIDPKIDAELADSMTFVNIRRARMVSVVDTHEEKRVITAAGSDSSMASAAGLELYPEDIVKKSTSSGEDAALEMKITRAKVVNLSLYGQEMTLRTQTKTVEDLLKEKRIELAPDDTMNVDGEMEIFSQMSLKIYRNGIQTISATEEIPFETQEVQDDTKYVGYREVQNAGANGVKSVVYEVNMQNGEEVARTKISEVVVESPVAQVEIVGTKPRSVPWTGSVDREAWLREAGIAESDWGYVQYIIEHEGSWCPVRWQNDRGCNDHGTVAPSRLGYGMFQATPGTKMASAGSDWLTNPVTQIRWANGYAVGRYGSWEKAYNFKTTKGWW